MLTKLYITLGVLVLIGALWWKYDNMVTTIANQKTAIASSDATIVNLKTSIADAEKRAKESNDRLNDHLTRVKAAEDETERLRNCVADGTCGLRIKSSCPRVPQTQGESSTGDIYTTDTELAPESRQAYFTHRKAVGQVTELLKSCIVELQSRTMCY